MKVLKDRGYEYGEHWGPHDIENREFGADAKSAKSWRARATRSTVRFTR
jgi:hypothetical protein